MNNYVEKGDRIYIGLEEEEVKPVEIMCTDNPFMIMGDGGCGKTNLIKVILTDENELISPMDELRKRFPNIMDIKYENRISNLDFDMDSKDITERETPLSLFSKFYQMQNGRELNEDEIKYFNKTMEEIKYWDKKAENLGGDK